MSEPAVRDIGRLEDIDGARIYIGADCDAVTIRGPRAIRLAAAKRGEFMRLWMEAERAAEAWAAAWGVPAPEDCVCGQTEAGCAEAGRQVAGHG
jgi:hypothetical protein